MGGRKGNWVREWEHPALMFFSVVFSAVSAHAVLWFYSSMDGVQVSGVDFVQPFIKWGLALAFTGFGYLSSRGLAHRLLRRERVGVYILICVVLEIVEVATNFMYSAVAIRNVGWLTLFAGNFHTVLTVLMYVVMPIVPIVTVVLAWVDMDLTRQKEGPAPFSNAGVRPGQASPQARMYAPPVQPVVNRASAQRASSSSPYGNGYAGVPRVAEQGASVTNQGQGQRQGGFQFPFRRRDAAEEQAQPRDMAGTRTMVLDPEKHTAFGIE